MPKVTMFHISAEAPDRLMAFYKNILGWDFQETPGPSKTWFITAGDEKEPGIDGMLHLRSRDSRVVDTIEVSNIDKMVRQISALGGRVVETASIPEPRKLALFEDPEGNLFQLREGPR